MDRHTKVNPAVNQGKSRAVSDNTCVTNSDSHGATVSHDIVNIVHIFCVCFFSREGSSAGTECCASIVISILIDNEALAVGSVK